MQSYKVFIEKYRIFTCEKDFQQNSNFKHL